MSVSVSGKWKSNLVSSGVPLEYEVAKLLVAREFSVKADFPYHRFDEGHLKQFSVDINADFLGPCAPNLDAGGHLHLLVECKARHPGVSWLFLPDPNEGDFSPLTWGSPLRAVDSFSKWFLHKRPYDIDALLPGAYKGVEIDVNSSKVHDSEIRHGLLQLQYALPTLLQDCIHAGAFGHPDDNGPFFYAPILVTDASLILSRRNLTRRKLEASNRPVDLGQQVPYLVVYVEAGPEFEAHSERQLKVLSRLIEQKAMKAAEESKKAAGIYDYDLPSACLLMLARGHGIIDLRRQFTHFIVCNAGHFGELLTRLKRSFLSCNRMIRAEQPEKRSRRRRRTNPR